MTREKDKINFLILIKIFYKHKIKFILTFIILLFYYFIILLNNHIDKSKLLKISFSLAGRYRVELYEASRFFSSSNFPKYNVFIYENINNKLLYSIYDVPLFYQTEIKWRSSKNNTNIVIGYIFEMHELNTDKCIGFSNCKELTNFLKRKNLHDQKNAKIIKKIPNLYFID